MSEDNLFTENKRESFGQQASVGFGQQASVGLGQQASVGFGQQANSSFGQQTNSNFVQQANSSFGQQANPDFGQQSSIGFGEPSHPALGQSDMLGFHQEKSSSFGLQVSHGAFSRDTSFAQDLQNEWLDVGAKEISTDYVVETGQAEKLRFSETLSKGVGLGCEKSWGFKECLLFKLKCLIPLYGVIIYLMCLCGNPRKYPKEITAFIRAQLLVNILLFTILTVIIWFLSLDSINSIGASIFS